MMEESKVILGSGQRLSVFKLHKNDDLSWAEAKMKRENEYQPWQIKLGTGRAAKRFKASKDGGVSENASYFIFYRSKNSPDTYEVCPVEDWYNVSATQRYKTLTAEEAEQKFEQRHKTLNYFTVMHKKNDDEGEEKSSGGNSKAFKITEMDDWDNSGDDFSGSDRDGDDDSKQKKGHKKNSVKKENSDDAPQEGKEDSDEGDFEQREVDYMSDTSSESDGSRAGEKGETEVLGIAEEEALRDLLDTSDEEEDAQGSPTKGAKSPLDKKAIVTTDMQPDLDGGGSDYSSDSDDYDVDEDKMDSMFMKKGLPAQLVKQVSSEQDTVASSSTTPVVSTQKQSVVGQPGAIASKRKPDNSQPTTSGSSQPPSSQPKRHCPADYSSSAPANSHEKLIEDLIKKYLSRKPMTLRALLKDLKNKLRRIGDTSAEDSEKLVNTCAAIIKRINPERRKINGLDYFSLKS